MLYVNKQQFVTAVQWLGNRTDIAHLFDIGVVRFDPESPGEMRLQLLSGPRGETGWVNVPKGSWILNRDGDTSDFWPVSDKNFKRGYEKPPVKG